MKDGEWQGLTHRVYDEDGYCVCCGNGWWKNHMPDCGIADDMDLYLEEQE